MINLEALGYKHWETDTNDFGHTDKFQKRMDSIEKYKDFPLCCTNDKIHLNIDYGVIDIHGKEHSSYNFKITQEANEIWCNLEIYGLSEETLTQYGVDEFEDRMMEMWKQFYFLQYQI